MAAQESPKPPARFDQKSGPTKAARPPRSAKGTVLAGAVIVGVTFFGFGAWASYAPLASAVTASASVVSEGRTQVVQHLEGGIVAEVNVREGQMVERGEVLFRLDPVQAASRADRFRNQLHARQVQAARLRAERDDRAEIDFPEHILERESSDIQAMIEGEQRLFLERRQSFEGQIELLEAKIIQFNLEVNGLNVQEGSKREQIRLITEELDSLRPLLEKGLVARSRLLALEREAARLEGEVGDIESRRARANESATEARLEMEQLKQQFREEVVAELREVETQIADLEEQLTAAEDVMSRLNIHAPTTGVAQNVAVTTLGAVISPGEPLLEISPEQAELVVAARVTPLDVHDVKLGQRAEVRFVALDVRKLPSIFGEIRSVSGDRIVDQSNNTEYFLVQVSVPPEEMKKLGDQTVHPGMPADIIVPTGSRTFMDYLLRPLSDAITRGLNEE
ncbi:HlyD family type I secretion periplasmic adaptor subunit [Pararhizobium haloflavum]|uniref:HlyD family type I secretion periplasmic adaptor subunit n=1 Tax=Pararhizobium haloflavum TaxID=2037914 RepID=UPI000C193E14|nr:HlyD family type I secretion periplasmic adaptor subunit [Pararhizobium haloflavum]